MISLSHISKVFRIPPVERRSLRNHFLSFFTPGGSWVHHVVLKDVSLEVASGEWLGISGSNGSGKSTLLRIMAGIYQADHGELQIEGSVAAVLELGSGFQPDLSARDNVLLYGGLLGMEMAQLRQQVPEIFAYAGVEEFSETPLKHFSSGMKARLAFALAMKLDADIYLFDEVLAVGDAAFHERCHQAFLDLKKAGKTAVLVSHSQDLLSQYCDRVLEMSAFTTTA